MNPHVFGVGCMHKRGQSASMNIYSEAGVRRSGFTLIELSIVLVVIGLIVGGVIAGQSLMRSSQLQSIISDQAKYVEAAKQFREKYGFWPGDFPNATTSWGAMTTCPPAAWTRASVWYLPLSATTGTTHVFCPNIS